MSLKEEILLVLSNCADENTRKEYQERLSEGGLVRDTNETSHFCAYFVPYNSQNKTILLGDHKKSGLWLMPGGHIESNETLLETLNREIEEELGVKDFFRERPEPFLLTITNIEHDTRPCKKHFDIWHLLETDGTDFSIDYTEYNEVRWLTITEAQQLVVDPASLKALGAIKDRESSRAAQKMSRISRAS